MKFTKIRLVGLDPIDLHIQSAHPSDPYILKAADGLGPPEVDVAIATTIYSGGIYQGRRPQGREIVLRVGLNPDYGSYQTASDLREEIYSLLSPGYGQDESVQIHIMNNDALVAQTLGFVKRIEVAAFTQDPEVQITIATLLPYFEAPEEYYQDPMGSLSAPELKNIGTARTGFYMSVRFLETLSSWQISDADGNKMLFEHNFLANDVLLFDTNPGSRGIWRTRDLITTKVVYILSPDSSWLTLKGGWNTFVTSSPSFEWGDVYYRPKFWGI